MIIVLNKKGIKINIPFMKSRVVVFLVVVQILGVVFLEVVQILGVVSVIVRFDATTV